MHCLYVTCKAGTSEARSLLKTCTVHSRSAKSPVQCAQLAAKVWISAATACGCMVLPVCKGCRISCAQLCWQHLIIPCQFLHICHTVICDKCNDHDNHCWGDSMQTVPWHQTALLPVNMSFDGILPGCAAWTGWSVSSMIIIINNQMIKTTRSDCSVAALWSTQGNSISSTPGACSLIDGQTDRCEALNFVCGLGHCHANTMMHHQQPPVSSLCHEVYHARRRLIRVQFSEFEHGHYQ